MNKTQLLIVLVVVSLALTFSVFGKTWENVPLTDKMCSTKFKDNPDSQGQPIPPAVCSSVWVADSA